MRVENDRPTSWQSMFFDGVGVNTTMTNLRGNGTSNAFDITTPSLNLTKATMGLDRASIAPHRVRAPSDPSGIRCMMVDFLAEWAIL